MIAQALYIGGVGLLVMGFVLWTGIFEPKPAPPICPRKAFIDAQKKAMELWELQCRCLPPKKRVVPEDPLGLSTYLAPQTYDEYLRDAISADKLANEKMLYDHWLRNQERLSEYHRMTHPH